MIKDEVLKGRKYYMHHKQRRQLSKKREGIRTYKNPSVRSRIIEKGMSLLRHHNTYEAEVERLRTLKENEIPYEIPNFLQDKYEITKTSYADMPVYFFKTENRVPLKHILYLHGGAYIQQPNVFHWRFVHQLTEEMPLSITLPIYPKAPRYTYVQSYAKVLLAYRKLIGDVGAENVILMGDSAGGGFALGFAQFLIEKGLPQPEQIILISPWLDITLSNPEIKQYAQLDPMLSAEALRADGESYAGDMDLNYYMLSPINGELRGLPPLTLFVGTHEIFLPDVRRLKEKLESINATFYYFEYPYMNHIFTTYPIPEAKNAITQIIEIIQHKY